MDYFFFDKDNCLVNLSNSILKYFTGECYHSTIKEMDDILATHKEKKVTIMLFDGFGKSIREKHLKETDFLRKKRVFTISSVFPPTTAAATTSVCSAKYPCETGWLGWRQYFSNHNVVVDMFTNNNSLTGDHIPGKYLSEIYCSYTPIWEIIAKTGAKANAVHPYPIDSIGPKSLNEFFEVADSLMKRSGDHFYYMYWADPDKTMHAEGTTSQKVVRICKEINKKCAELAKNNKDNLIIVLSDHSMVDTKYFYLYEHEDFANMCERIFSLDARTCSFNIKPEFKDKFVDCFNKYYGGKFILKTKQEVIDEKWFGEGEPHPIFEDFLGDFMVTSIADYGFSFEKDFPLIANHAGSTSEESLIDVSILNK